MNIRKLVREEHHTTRALWESVFAEDTEAFLDYYYQMKTRENQIYVIDEDAKIRAMLQLNPYRVQMEQQKFTLHYIIAVATAEKYRGKGMMRQLLLQAMQDMYQKKEPFTFLMPAAEAIYSPYDFRFIYDQIQMKITGTMSKNDAETNAGNTTLRNHTKMSMRDAMTEDAGKLASFARQCINDVYQVYAVRNKNYYETMILEQRSENGGVKMVYSGRKLVGCFAYGNEGELEIREPLFAAGHEAFLLQAIYEMTGDMTTAVSCVGFTEKMRRVLEHTHPSSQCSETIKKPIIMARILHLETFLKALRTIDNQPMCCSFAVIDPLLIQNNRIVRVEYRPDLDEMLVKDTEDSDGVLTVDVFTSLVFGYRSMEEIEQDPGVILTERFKTEFAKLRRLDRVFLNEIV